MRYYSYNLKSKDGENLKEMFPQICFDLYYIGKSVPQKRWQAIETNLNMLELNNVVINFPLPPLRENLSKLIQPDLEWCKIHFSERVGGQPLNPGESYKFWPYYNNSNESDKNFRPGGLFSHTYMERYWPIKEGEALFGMRFNYGTLQDVVNLLSNDPYTRQAYLPVFFPEDTGATEGQRIPCTLGYLFMIREGKLNITYYIRSCDLIRHFRNDVYLTAKLAYWVLDELKVLDKEFFSKISIGEFIMNIGSLHIFEQEKKQLTKFIKPEKMAW